MLLRSAVESHYSAFSHTRLIFSLFFVIALIIIDVNVYSAAWATGEALKELSHQVINKVSNEALVHIATTAMSPTGGTHLL